MPADRNLVFGLLALQMEFVTREQLLDGMNAWMLQKETPLGELLVRRGALADDDRADLDRLVTKHIRRHGDAAKSLASLRVEPEARLGLERLADADVQASLASLPPPGATVTGAPAARGPDPGGGPASRRYRTLRLHATGGLGEVHLAIDEELRREVALKRLRSRFADDPASRARFVREAEVTGHLDHPGVVAVHGLVSDEDGRPEYAMRFLRGDTLHEAIRRFREAGPRDPSRRSLAFRELLGRFVAVCYAVGYAHSRGVVHRDLKPANVMLGEFGETLVVDWGLAKVLEATGEQTTPYRPVPAAGDDAAATRLGQVMGTPAFLPPEQARGDHDLVGPATDVWALGAILYAVLTGAAPYPGEDPVERARACDFRPPRKADPEAPPALEAVCLKAMAADPAARYPTAAALAGDVERWLADEPVSAYREPWPGRLRRWGRRHRPLVAGAVTALVALGLLATTAAALIEQKRQAVVAEQAETELQRQDAVANARLAGEQRQLALETLQRVVADIQGELKGKPDLQGLRKKLLRAAQEGLRKVARSAETSARIDREQLRVHRELGAIFSTLEIGGTAESGRQFQTALALARQLAERAPDDAQAQRDLAQIHLWLALTHQLQAEPDPAEEHAQAGIAILRRLPLTDEVRDELSRAHDTHGHGLLLQGKASQALAAYQEAHRLLLERPDVGTVNAGQLVLSYIKQVEALLPLGQLDKAQRFADAAAQNAELMAKVQPGPASERLWSRALTKRGDVARERRELPTARGAYEAALALDEKFAEVDPRSAEAQRDLYLSQVRLGEVLRSQGENEKARSLFEQSLALRTRLAEADPTNDLYQREVAVNLIRLGDLLVESQDYPAARKAVRRAVEIAQRRAKADPKTAQVAVELAVAWNKLGDVEMAALDLAEAERHYRAAQDVLAPLVRSGNVGQGHPLVAALGRDLDSCRAARRAVQDIDWALRQDAASVPDLLSVRGRVLAAKGDLAGAAATADRLTERGTKPEHRYEAACLFALCAGAAADQAERERYAARAVGLLRDAVAKGYKYLPRLRQNPDLASLRSRPEFQALLRVVEPAPKK